MAARGYWRGRLRRRGYRGVVAVLWITDDRFLDHDTGRAHPERPDRLRAVIDGVRQADLGDALVPTEPRMATDTELLSVHHPSVLDSVQRVAQAGGGRLDPDTVLSAESEAAARLAAGAGMAAIEGLDNGVADAAFCAVRPPGHHATPVRSMGFCMFNSAAICARALAERGEKVLVVDYDAHHGNGTQDVFWEDGRVMYVSWHQYPFYPGTGGLLERGAAAGVGTTINLPMPVGATGDVYRRGWEEAVLPAVEAFDPDWLVLSAGFDAHRADPLTSLGLAAGDFADLTQAVIDVVPPGRRIAFLEGGYDLDALADCAAAAVAALAGTEWRPEPATGGGPGAEVAAAAAALLS
ncbi:MAG: histone deacetylase [Acidimicrobiia bacterium]|nr:histone deacetylase [Acidimicrobiia bacterium]MYB09005.1 histone deacetylase [Acidimicrobiia bacterium]MYB72850.1 histone deacetylase [Acidimicrobiia bacterium]MYG57886.1 histone deacetylase [Acidimicrobiia bacterium]MYI00571.1 histone deacetylase [Acidimicrobiia bacterium]